MFFFSFKYIQKMLPMRLTYFKLFVFNILIPKERSAPIDDVSRTTSGTVTTDCTALKHPVSVYYLTTLSADKKIQAQRH